MALNDGVLDDLDNNNPVLDNDIVQLPQGSNVPKESMTILVDNSQKESVIPPEEMAKLPEMDVAIKLVEDNQEKVVQLSEIEEEIIGDSTMSQSKAELVNASFEGFLSGSVKLVEFTQAPSKTNVGYAKSFMRKAIAKEEAAVVSSYQLLIEQPLTDAKEMFMRLSTSYVPAICDQLSWLQCQNADLKQKLVECKDSIFPTEDGEFTNITLMDLSESPSINCEVSANFTALRQLLKHHDVHSFVLSIKNGKSVQDALSMDAIKEYAGIPVTTVDLLDFYATDIRSQLTLISELSQEYFAKLNQIQEEAMKNMVTSEQSNKYISQTMPDLEESFAYLSRALTLLHRLSLLNYNSKAVFEFLHTL